MPSRIVDADPDRNDRNINISERIERGNAVAEILKSLPWFIWAVPCWLLAGLIILAVAHDGVAGFSNHVLGWFALVPWAIGAFSAVKAFMWCHNTYNKVRTDTYNRKLLAANVEKAQASVLTVQYKNQSLLADVQIRQQIPNLLAHLAYTGVAFEYDAKGNLKVLGAPGNVRVNEVNQQGQIGAGVSPLALGAGGSLPDRVLYEEIRGQVPMGHVLVGVGANGFIDTLEAKQAACVWIVGLSGTGKTSTTVIRVEERATAGHKFLGVDPHWFKDDSLYHSIYETLDGQPGAYKDLFLMPIAGNTEQAKVVLQAFLDEFNGRKSGRIPKPWSGVTLLVDELGSLADTTCEEEEEVRDMLKHITRICGQEARNFMMGGIFISQQATELAWLRKVALMVIVHQLMQDSEKKLATNNDKAVMEDMKVWPIGRTYVFGVGFGQQGPRTVQQPYYAGRRVNGAAPTGNDAEQDEDSSMVVESDEPGDNHLQEEQSSNVIPALSGDMRIVYDACQQLVQGQQAISSRAVESITGFKKDKANNLLNRLADLGYIPKRKAV